MAAVAKTMVPFLALFWVGVLGNDTADTTACMTVSPDEASMVLAMREETDENGQHDHLKMLQQQSKAVSTRLKDDATDEGDALGAVQENVEDEDADKWYGGQHTTTVVRHHSGPSYGGYGGYGHHTTTVVHRHSGPSYGGYGGYGHHTTTVVHRHSGPSYGGYGGYGHHTTTVVHRHSGPGWLQEAETEAPATDEDQSDGEAPVTAVEEYQDETPQVAAVQENANVATDGTKWYGGYGYGGYGGYGRRYGGYGRYGRYGRYGGWGGYGGVHRHSVYHCHNCFHPYRPGGAYGWGHTSIRYR